METKVWYLSKTIWGAIFTIVGSIGIVGVTYNADSNMACADLTALTGYVKDAVLTASGGTLFGGLLSLWGRLSAKTKVVL